MEGSYRYIKTWQAYYLNDVGCGTSEYSPLCVDPIEFIDGRITWATQKQRDRKPLRYHVKNHIPIQKLKLISGRLIHVY